MVVAALLAFAVAPKPPVELYDYLAKKDPAFRAVAKQTPSGRTEFEMTSQVWQGIEWKHSILMQSPADSKSDTAILYITGDGPRAGDLVDLGLISAATKMPVAMLFDIPNQPIWEMKEDDLIAHTFEKYLETKDATWPLLFPMTKAAIRAMDAIQIESARNGRPINKFVVTGASKRGWTTWFVGAAKDKRVVGIAPMVYDNLNVPAQMKHQIDSWGAYSLQIQDYTRRGLQQKLDSKEGAKLAAIIDPYTYRQNITVPTLIVNGANDMYWTADAASKYWGDLRQRKHLLMVPNAGHSLGSKVQAIETVGAFARSAAGEFKMPTVDGSAKVKGNEIKASLKANGAKPVKVTLWVANSRTGDFRLSTWRPAATSTGDTAAPLKASLTEGLNSAAFIEARFDIGGRQFSLTTTTQVFMRK